MESAASPSMSFYVLLSLSSSLATLGLIADSSAVIIGAMIIAPLMNPIIAHSFSLARSNRSIWLRSSFSMASGIILVLGTSYLLASFVGFQLQGKEILSRSNPNLIDLGVAIASGIAGAIAWSRGKIANALPGVAIAVALVPPLCTAGIGFSMGDSAFRDPTYSNLDSVDSVQWGALLLFFTNLGAILVFGALVFFIQGYGKLRFTGLAFFLPVILIVFLTFPLTRKFTQFSDRGRTLQVLQQLSHEFPDWHSTRLRGLRVRDSHDTGETLVILRVDAPAGILTNEDGERISEALSEHFDRAVKVELYVSEYHLLQASEEAPAEPQGSGKDNGQ